MSEPRDCNTTATSKGEPGNSKQEFESWVVDSFWSRLNANKTMFSDAGEKDGIAEPGPCHPMGDPR